MNRIITTTTFTKPSLEVGFRNQPDEFRAHFKKYYVDTGKLIEKTERLSEDGLSLTVTMTWSSDRVRLQYLSDPVIEEGFSRMAVYNTENNIGFKWTQTEIDESGNVVRQWTSED